MSRGGGGGGRGTDLPRARVYVRLIRRREIRRAGLHGYLYIAQCINLHFGYLYKHFKRTPGVDHGAIRSTISDVTSPRGASLPASNKSMYINLSRNKCQIHEYAYVRVGVYNACVCLCVDRCACMGMRSRRYDVTALVDYAAYA